MPFHSLIKIKTRLFVTNSIGFLPEADEIIMMENGSIIESGTYNQLLIKNEQFIEFINDYEVIDKKDSGMQIFFFLFLNISNVKYFILF